MFHVANRQTVREWAAWNWGSWSAVSFASSCARVLHSEHAFIRSSVSLPPHPPLRCTSPADVWLQSCPLVQPDFTDERMWNRIQESQTAVIFPVNWPALAKVTTECSLLWNLAVFQLEHPTAVWMGVVSWVPNTKLRGVNFIDWS